jgi:hypothetical protein
LAMKARFLLVAGMIAAAAMMRVLPHPYNFTPIGAMALFGGAHFQRKRWAFAVPLLAMLLSDCALQLLTPRGFHSSMFVVYGTFALIVGMGTLLRGRIRPLPVLSASLAASLLFFLTTNFAAWTTDPQYPKTIAGLAMCYAAGLPFFSHGHSFFLNTVAGDLFYSTLLFGGLALVEWKVPALSAKPAVELVGQASSLPGDR